MRFSVGSDDARPIVEHVVSELRARGHEVIAVTVKTWGEVALDVARAVAKGDADQGIVMCWTGTGVTMAANKVPGIRAALCVDAATAAGARKWNDANVLTLSLRLLSDPVATEILEAWLGTRYGGTEGESLAEIRAAEVAR
ncbi:MAG: RpiB/LacA/LacB family sugar-phosphate isomerase [Myxococcales bacterium]|nr:RpiB/LacA/LacB family sugar-phosphate isomerase [Myxococcales bacterium]